MPGTLMDTRWGLGSAGTVHGVPTCRTSDVAAQAPRAGVPRGRSWELPVL